MADGTLVVEGQEGGDISLVCDIKVIIYQFIMLLFVVGEVD